MKKGKTPGIKVRVAKDGVIQLLDRATGRWLANVRWRPHGEVWLELAEEVGKAVLNETLDWQTRLKLVLPVEPD